ncbi:MAG: hypothetical protein RLZZ502_1215 [Pseudomonadota bacterium]|jgi:uncharacterized membrane protein YfcA
MGAEFLGLPLAWWLIYLCLGALVGVLAGLLGIGGGVTMVPFFLYCMPLHGVNTPKLMQTVLATSMCIVMFTGVSSARAHHARGGVIWPVVWTLIPAIALGNFIGAQVTHLLPSKILMKIFAVCTIYIGFTMLRQKKEARVGSLPSRGGLLAFGLALGFVCTLVSAGGAFMSVPFLTWSGVGLTQAIGTASALGVPISIFSSLFAAYSGWHETGIPSPNLGYIYVPVVMACSVGSVLTAPFGARLGHGLPVATLKRMFALLMFCIALKMLHSAFFQ